jgi:hypothetical protein
MEFGFQLEDHGLFKDGKDSYMHSQWNMKHLNPQPEMNSLPSSRSKIAARKPYFAAALSNINKSSPVPLYHKDRALFALAPWAWGHICMAKPIPNES